MNIIKNAENELFDNRKVIGNNLLQFIKEKGYSKLSFSKIVDISRPTLDKIIKGEVDSKTTFISHIKKIIDKKIISIEEFMNYKDIDNNNDIVTMYSDNAPENYKRKDNTKELFMILDDLINLSEIYQ